VFSTASFSATAVAMTTRRASRFGKRVKDCCSQFAASRRPRESRTGLRYQEHQAGDPTPRAARGSAATRPVLPTNMALPGQVREAKNAVSGSSRRPADPRPELEVRTSRFASKIMKERAIV